MSDERDFYSSALSSQVDRSSLANDIDQVNRTKQPEFGKLLDMTRLVRTPRESVFKCLLLTLQLNVVCIFILGT